MPYFEICSSAENSRSGAFQDDDPRIGVKTNSLHRFDQLEDKIFTEWIFSLKEKMLRLFHNTSRIFFLK